MIWPCIDVSYDITKYGSHSKHLIKTVINIHIWASTCSGTCDYRLWYDLDLKCQIYGPTCQDKFKKIIKTWVICEMLIIVFALIYLGVKCDLINVCQKNILFHTRFWCHCPRDIPIYTVRTRQVDLAQYKWTYYNVLLLDLWTSWKSKYQHVYAVSFPMEHCHQNWLYLFKYNYHILKIF